MLKTFLKRFSHCNHQQWGHLLGMVVGFVLGIYSLPHLSNVSLPWIGTLTAVPLILVKVITVPFIAGTFANIFSNLGAAIDIVTNHKTLMHFFLKSQKTNEKSSS